AYIRLKQGFSSPRSGSMELNGKEVSEQIGSQIFIDCFGMVAPGNPELAAKLAGKAARVFHDGEAVFAAQVVAAMVSVAFEERDMEKILDRAVQVIPPDSLIAQLHRDVRAWAQEFPDWNQTFAKISEKYGYAKYGGNCHVVPNHAVMVMAWAYGGNDFHKALSIACTAGWDTDCNAGNVGAAAALCAGLEHICDTYDFRTPFADRIYVPAADGSCAVSDVLEQALFIAKIGRRIMKMPELPAPKGGAKYHFEMPGALHGFMPAQGKFSAVSAAAPAGFSGKYCMLLRFTALPENPCSVETPLIPAASNSGYATPCTPALYSGSTLRMKGCLKAPGGSLKLFLATTAGERLYSPAAVPDEEGRFELEWVPEFPGTAAALGIECASAKAVSGEALIDSIAVGGTARFVSEGETDFSAWLSSMAGIRARAFSNDPDLNMRYFSSNEEPGVLVTGNRAWGDTRIRVRFQIHAADRAGVIFHYQGLCRWVGAIFSRRSLQIVRNLYGEETLAETDFVYGENRPMLLEIRTHGSAVELSVDGKLVLTAQEDLLESGGAGIFADHGTCGFGRFEAEARLVPQA
ncbi:MAG: ADP-ribosylglycohydrolase family protein, partial [Lentisphaeria bacterium]|nr:ADP-ribosylglycohydrolase family protein [Lentisphaeria bacterium]